MDKSIGNQKTTGGLPGTDEISMGDRDTPRPEGAVLGRVDQYGLIRELGGGGFGTVYLARDTVAGVDVAVKGLPPLVKNNAEELERIRENFALVSRLHHPNIAAALHLHQAREATYADERVRQALRVLPGDTLMVMAYAPGVTLNRWRRQFPDGKVPVGQALEVCRQTAAALDYAHGEKVVHRDVKPSNVMVETRATAHGDVRPPAAKAALGVLEGECPREPQVSVRVLDFGLAAEIRSSMSRVSQEKGDTSGTRPYMAPEQWAGKRQDGRTDQYALAALFYELVSGSVPFASAFDTGDPAIMSNAAKTEAPEPLAELSKAQNAALLRGLAKEPGARFASCGEFIATLGGRALADRSLGEGGSPRTAVGGGRKTALWLAGVAAVAVLCYGAYASYRSCAARLAGERAAAEQSAKLDAAQKAKAAELKAAAEAALEKGDLESAGARIAELKGAGGRASPRAVEELQKRYESKAGERETNKRYAAASVAREAALKLDAGQGFGYKLKALEVTWREAEAARQSQGWGQALSGYDAALAACKALAEEDVSREDAKTRRGEAEKAKDEASRAEAAKDAEKLFGDGGRASSRAAELFEKGAFAEASKAWREASQSYTSAKSRALAVQAYAKAKAAFESELGGRASPRAALLESHGGAKWSEVKRLQKLGEAGTDDPAAGEKAYKEALAALPKAVEEAQAAEHAAKLAAALAAARQAKAAGEWQACLDRAGEALALAAGNAEAAALKREAEGSLVPTLTVECEVAGARVSDGTDTFDAPHTFGLKAGGSYNFKVAAVSARYKPATLDITADWRGPKTRKVALEEVKGPIEDEAWTSPATGMEFVWVSALKLWVGKYEVTNGEYRKKDPSHDSKDSRGNTLNGDRQPVVYVNFDDAKAYAEWLTERDRDKLGWLRYRVMAEREWQACAQCGDGREYPWGNTMPPKWGNYADSAAKREFTDLAVIDGYTDGYAVACPVEKSGENEWGIYGLGGNVWECCASDGSGSAFGAWRGASWYYDDPDRLRCAFRYGNFVTARDYDRGFRLALSR